MIYTILSYAEYPLRLLGAAFCGALIGYERENKMKMAGVRVHAIVCMASALMMVISKYGFYDVLSANITLDPSRVAASVVTAIGFLGAGIIFTHKMNIRGLTTSAGLWATVGIGMALGAGMYVLGITSVIFILLLQFLHYRHFRILKSNNVEQITLRLKGDENLQDILKSTFDMDKFRLLSAQMKRVGNNQIEVKLYVAFPANFDVFTLLEVLRNNPEIISIDL